MQFDFTHIFFSQMGGEKKTPTRKTCLSWLHPFDVMASSGFFQKPPFPGDVKVGNQGSSSSDNHP